MTVHAAAESVSVRNRLLNAAERVVARDGVQSLTLEIVAKEAGVSKGGLLYHFPSKAALIRGVVDRMAAQCDADHEKAIDAAGPEAPGRFTKAYLEARTEPFKDEELPLHTAILAATGTDPQLLDPFRKRCCEWQGRLENDGIDPALAMIVKLAMDGLCLGRLMGMPVPEGELRDKVLNKLRGMIEGGR
jgi:AcrR family transcriptional regulator